MVFVAQECDIMRSRIAELLQMRFSKFLTCLRLCTTTMRQLILYDEIARIMSLVWGFALPPVEENDRPTSLHMLRSRTPLNGWHLRFLDGAV
jgi:hypothetical protein